jgi:cytochrome c oxidase assembly protein subunit 11
MSAPVSNSAGLLKLVGVALTVFVLTFSLVPLYRIACEKVFGIRLEQGPGQARAAAEARKARTVTVQFDGGVNSKLPWAFHPEQLTMQVVPGELYEAQYFARNDSQRAHRAISPRPNASASLRRRCRPAKAATCRCVSSSIRICRPT